MPDWLFGLLAIGLGCVGWIWAGNLLFKRKLRKLAARRPSLSREDFVAQLATDASGGAAGFVWDQALFYMRPIASPHPDDHLVADLSIDEEDFSFDWTDEWAEQLGIHSDSLPDWPTGWPATLRNYARWLDLAQRP